MARAPNGLQSSLRLCESDKVKDRSEGISAIRTFFSNKENLAVFQETARRDGGGGWVAFFQCLFQVVVLEKKALLKKSANAQTEKRLADAISLVRFMAERSVYMISRKALSALVTHMSSLLVYSSAIFPPAALDYAKALRTLLSYPPHLEHLEPRSWKALIGICWSAILGDEVNIDDEWEEDADIDMADPSPTSGAPSTQAIKTFSKGRTNTQATTELALLIPILLSSSNAPILSPMPTANQPYVYEQSVGLSILIKVQRFFVDFPTETSSHLPVLRSMNLILADLELNCRSDFVTASLKLLPSLVAAWSFRNKAMREQVLIALRMILPFLTHKIGKEKDKSGVVKASLEKLMNIFGKESTLRGGILPLDLSTVRLKSNYSETGSTDTPPFETRCFTAGHDFDHDSALQWATLELYSQTFFYLDQNTEPIAPPTPSNSDGTQAKRRKPPPPPIKALASSTSMGSLLSRLHALQVIVFIIDNYWDGLDHSTQDCLRERLLLLLEDDDVNLQSWAFVGISTIAVLPSVKPNPGLDDMTGNGKALGPDEIDLTRAWQFAIRKSSQVGVSRAACYAAHSILAHGKIDTPTAVRDLGTLLQSVDIQGPPYPHDSVCALLDRALQVARQDVRLYTMRLEERVVSWLIKWNALEGTRGKARLDQHAPADFIVFLSTICHFNTPTMSRPSTTDLLPDCAIVDRVMIESRTQPIREFTLHGRIHSVPVPHGPTSSPREDERDDAGAYLEGRPKRISDAIDAQLKSFVNDWPAASSSTDPRPAIPPDRCRRAIDMVIIALGFQATLQINGVRPDGNVIANINTLIERILPTLSSSAYDVPSQHLMWKGLEPLISKNSKSHTLWPVLLKPNALSGIRSDFLPAVDEGIGDDDALDDGERLLTALWSLNGVASSLKSLFEPALEIFSGSESVQMPNSAKFHMTQNQDDDDFGEIRTAESDAMPLSQEAMECQRTTSSLLSLLARLRLRGSMLTSTNRLPPRDSNLVNAFLSSEGQRMVQLGTVICEAVRDGTLRLNLEAVDLILSSIDEMHRSYAYTRDPGLLRLLLEFMTASAPLWLSVDGSKSDLAEQVISLAKNLHRRAAIGQVTSWQVRVALLVFIDEYLDYDPDQTVWRASSESLKGEDSNLVASDIVSAGLMDPDIHVRFRAATSTAGILYLSSIPFDQHLPFYTDLVNVLPREPKHWDSFITDILWKLNCCITSPQLRAATIYHLYEVPPSTGEFNHHLQMGLETVSKRLGLDGIAPLLLAYAPLIISSQIVTSQSPMRVPHRLYGFATRKAFAMHTLEVAASSILLYSLAKRHRTDSESRQYSGAAETFSALCAAAGAEQAEVGVRHFPDTAARALSDPNSGLFADYAAFDRAAVPKMLLTIPGISAKDASSVIASVAEDIMTHLFTLLDLDTSDDEIIAILDGRSGKKKLGTTVYSALIPPQQTLISAPALVPSATLQDVLGAIDHLTETNPKLSLAKVLFNTLVRLFHRVNSDFLLSEQYRHLRSIALAISLHSDNMTHPAILGFLLRETVPLLKMTDIAPIALSILKWGFDRIGRAPRAPDDLDQLIIGLGDIRGTLPVGNDKDGTEESSDSSVGIGAEFDRWIRESAPGWQNVASMEDALAIAKSTWPEHLAATLTNVVTPSFEKLCSDAEKVKTTDILPMCGAMLRTLRNDSSTKERDMAAFQNDAFWNVKSHLHPSLRNKGNVSAFIDLLYASNGQIHPPTLDSITASRKDDSLTPLRGRSRSDAGPHLRAALIDRIVDMTRVPEYKARSTALAVLQALLPHVDNDSTGQLVPKATQDLLSLLNPVTPTTPTLMSNPVAVLKTDETWTSRSRDAATWSTSLAALLCHTIAVRDPFYAVLPTLFETIPSAARDLLPLLVQLFMSLRDDGTVKDLQERYKNLSAHFIAVLQYARASVDTLRAIVEIMLHLRHFQPHWRDEELGHESWLDVNKLALSQAALKCGSFATALMFLETYRSDRKDKPRSVNMNDPTIQKMMFEIYSNVEDPDGFYGIQNNDTWDALDRRMQHEGKHWRSLGLHSAALGANPSLAQNSVKVMRDLHNLGFDQVSSSVFSSLQQSSDKAADTVNEPLLFELAWRTSDWDLPVPAETVPSPESLLYTSLRAVHRERDLSVAQIAVNSATNLEIGILRDCGVERMTEIKKTVTDLICLNEVQKWLDPGMQSEIDSRKIDSPTLSRFTSLSSAFAFGDAERIMATRRSLITAAKEREKQNIFGDMATPRLETLCQLETQCLLRLGEMARNEGNTQASINALVSVQELEKERGSQTDAVQDEFSQVLWAQGEHVLAIRHVDGRIQDLMGKKGDSGSRAAILLSRLANWTAKSKLRAPQDVTGTFEEALKLVSAHKVSQLEQSRLFHDYALFADSQQAAVAKSPELERLTSYKERKEAELRSSTPVSAKKSGKSTNKTEMTLHLEREMKEDEAAIEALVKERSMYAKTALKMYAKALALSDEHDDSTTRMISLWLEHDEDEEVNTAFSGPLQQIPSHKFIFLSPQLAARLDRPKVLSPFNDALNKLVLRISMEHPYHILYQVITLADGLSSLNTSRHKFDAGAEGRGPAAAAILASIASSTDKASHMARTASADMQKLASAATAWCLARSKEEESASIGKKLNVPSDCPLRQLPPNLAIPIATAPPPMDPTGKYENITTLIRYRSTYAVLGGIHRPKRMIALGSDGKDRSELFKGEDELRQDAVMEQVFEMSNKLLKRDRKTKTRDLRFRTYCVIPLARKTGIMEFVGNSQAIGDWLKPAHQRYGKINGDISADEFRKALKPIQEKEKNWNQLPPKFTNLRSHFHPVMRHFFTEKHRDPMAWFTMRLNYTRSVAVTSMVGWMLGIGDRHCSNILIDQKSGELVHIDFGIVFEDGRRLRIPEKVPFRLTNDLVDGFGVTGVDGTFRRCSEHTLRVLRESSELIMTVLEVFKHDPLYAWDADPEKLQRAQGGGRVSAAGTTSASALEKADRILSKIKGKLRDDLSVEYTVNQLIQEARDVDNLAKIFVGWQPWF